MSGRPMGPAGLIPLPSLGPGRSARAGHGSGPIPEGAHFPAAVPYSRHGYCDNLAYGNTSAPWLCNLDLAQILCSLS
jgi:hypothetical protein